MGVLQPGPRGTLSSGPTRFPDPASQRPTPPPAPATASRRPSGEYSIASADLSGEGLETAGPAQRLGVDQVHPAVDPRDRERAAVGADGERRGALAGLVEGVGAERPPEPAVAGHVPDDRAGVVGGRVERAPVGAEGLAPHRATVALESLDRASLSQVPDDHLAVPVRAGDERAPVGAEGPDW